MSRTAPSVHIEHLNLDLRGVPPTTAEAAVRQLGPALQQAFAGLEPRSVAAGDTLRVSADIDARALSVLVAAHVAAVIRNSDSDHRHLNSDV